MRGQIAVAQVVLNRAFSGNYPNTVCGVVYQNKHRHLACQFTFACDNIADVIREPDMWERAKKIAKAMLDGQLWLPEVDKSTHYHAYWVRPSWVSEMKRMYKFGVHTFYRPRTWGDGSDAPSWGNAGADRGDFGEARRRGQERSRIDAGAKASADAWFASGIVTSRIDIERDVEIRRRMRQRAGRDVVDAGGGDLRDRVQRDAAGRLQHDAAVGDLHRLGQRRDIHVVEQHDIGETGVEHLAQLVERIDLDLDLDEMAGMRAGALQHRRGRRRRPRCGCP